MPKCRSCRLQPQWDAQEQGKPRGPKPVPPDPPAQILPRAAASGMELTGDQAPGIGSTGMISTDSPGKIAKCGCFSKSLEAASCDSARTTTDAPRSLLKSSMPRSVTCFVEPSGPPISEAEARCFSIQAFHAAMPCCSRAWRSTSGSAIHACMRGLVLLPRKTARKVLFVVMRYPLLLCG